VNTEKYRKRIAKLRYMAESNRAKGKLLKEKGRFGKGGKFEGEAEKYDAQIRNVEEGLREKADILKLKAMKLRERGRLRKAQKLEGEAQKALSLVSKPRPSEGMSEYSVYKEKEIVTREIVRIPCKYCGTLINQTDTKCPSCGACLT
jgi:rubrerythrin